MKFGFIIDNQRCIGCHACTVACKAEHEVPVGVNRTWVKYIEKGTFPDTRRLFSVMRCNHCEDAPCVDICPTSALYIRTDGIVDFNNQRCIGCKACMQACPYDALYIDPETDTAAKCNYCAHRIDVGLEPACVNVCPTNAIISGDMDNPASTISKTLARNQVTVRKAEKATKPKLFYIEGDQASLTPLSSEPLKRYLWSDQKKGVGHHAGGEDDGIKAVISTQKKSPESDQLATSKKEKANPHDARRVYDAPSKGLLWGWEVAGYIFTKAIAAGIFPIGLLFHLLGIVHFSDDKFYLLAGLSMLFLGLTGLLLVLDLDQPKRFVYVLLRPHFNSWLVKGAYIISGYAFLLILWLGLKYGGGKSEWLTGIGVLILIFAVLTSTYTAFLFAQAKGRDFWQSPLLVFNMLTHTLIGSSAFFIFLSIFIDIQVVYFNYLLIGSLIFHLIMLMAESYMTHPTTDSQTAFKIITKGRFKNTFYYGMVGVGILVPLAIGFTLTASDHMIYGKDLFYFLLSLTSLVGMWYSIKAWVYAPQMIPLS